MPSFYIVEERIGDGEFREIAKVDKNEYIANVNDDKIHSYRIIAGNEGGVSFPSEVLALCDKGKDAKSVTIAAASIIAKVVRDDMMIELDAKYPGYNLKQNKGYCTLQHMNLLKENGITDIHRKTYEPVCSYIKHDEQITLDEFLGEDEN